MRAKYSLSMSWTAPARPDGVLPVTRSRSATGGPSRSIPFAPSSHSASISARSSSSTSVYRKMHVRTAVGAHLAAQLLRRGHPGEKLDAERPRARTAKPPPGRPSHRSPRASRRQRARSCPHRRGASRRVGHRAVPYPAIRAKSANCSKSLTNRFSSLRRLSRSATSASITSTLSKNASIGPAQRCELVQQQRVCTRRHEFGGRGLGTLERVEQRHLLGAHDARAPSRRPGRRSRGSSRA